MKERRAYFKSEARFMLRYNYLRQIFMTSAIVLITAGLNSVRDFIIDLINLESMAFIMSARIFFDILIFMFILPMFLGIVYVSQKLFEGERLAVGEMFEFFKSPANFTDCLKFILSVGIRWIIFFMPFLIFGALISYIRTPLYVLYPQEVTLDIIAICVCIVYFAAFFLCLIFMMRYFAVLFIFIKNPSLGMNIIIKKSIQIMKKRKAEALLFLLSFSLWIAISYFLAGILFIFFTFPYIILSYLAFFSSVEEDIFSPVEDFMEIKEEQTENDTPLSDSAAAKQE